METAASGTAAGALCGLAGVYLQHHGAPMLATTLAVVMLLAFASAAAPGLRSAPVAALIILSAGGIPGHSALQVALLRMAQIGIGVGVELAVSTLVSEYHAGAAFRRGLRRVARHRRTHGRCAKACRVPRRSAFARARARPLGRLAGAGRRR